ncbi:MAG TPA: hypothetical protein VE008_01100, partial [Burkholderiales bacterium]|nr:hypothetical protein [Burkholderiales bacterium]
MRHKRSLFLRTIGLTLATSVGSTIAFIEPAAAHGQGADVICSGTLGGGSTVTNIKGDVTVPEKASCTLNFVTVAG